VKASAMRSATTSILLLLTLGLTSAFLLPALFQLIIMPFKIFFLLFMGLSEMFINTLILLIPIAQTFGLIFGLGTLIVVVVTLPVLLWKKIFALKNTQKDFFDL
jgi:hypothetical protein